ncbi:MAG TPA: zinc-dependent alcohol dehydrogenase family protein [bacterium]|nr:zinc-dependent alcohol dehydrogenase family protein [bacterium]
MPEPGAGELLIRVHACAVCHTDLHQTEGELPPHRLPVTPGHQAVGTVVRAGPGVEAGWTGRRAGVAWLHRACGRCAWCRRGEENLCERPLFTGYDVDGGFAEYLVAPADFVYAIPGAFGSEAAAPLLCAGIIGFRALRLAGAAPGCRVGLFGFGASAHLAIQVARHWGCEVHVVTRSRGHRRLAEALGAAWVGGPGEAPPAPLDAAVVFAPSGRVAVEALERLRPGGTLAINAIHLDGIPAFDYRLLYGERTVRSVTNSTRADGVEFLALAAAIPVRVETETLPLAEANRALARLARGEISGAAVLAGSSGSDS